MIYDLINIYNGDGVQYVGGVGEQNSGGSGKL